MFLIVIAFILVVLYYKYGYYYAIGSSEYAKYNNTQNGMEYYNFYDSITIEFTEFKEACREKNIKNIIMEASDVFHSITKYIVLTLLSEKIYCSSILWSILFFINLPCTIKLGSRYKKNNCIRNHKNVNNTHHKCFYKEY